MLTFIMNWIKGARWRMSFSHCFEALPIQTILCAASLNVWFAAIGVIAWYWSRKKLEVEIANEQPGQTHVDTWAFGWFPWQWSGWQQLDVLMPAVSSFAIAALVGEFVPALAQLPW